MASYDDEGYARNGCEVGDSDEGAGDQPRDHDSYFMVEAEN